MISSGAQDDAPILDENLEHAQRLPGTLISAAAGSAEEAVRPPGLILTKEQLINLKRYETRGLALPTSLKDVVWYLGYETGAGLNLEARDFQATFSLIHHHAKRWNPLRAELMNTGSELWVFADQMLVYERGVEQLYGELKQKPVDALEPADQEDFLHYLQEVAALVLRHRNATDELKHRLDGFATDLSTKVMPELQLKLRSIANNTLPAEVRSLNEAINHRAEQIEDKHRSYKTLTKTFKGAALNVMSLGIYHSVEAEKIRRQINTLRQAQGEDIRLMEQKNSIHASLQRVRDDLQDASLIVLDADIATHNLVSVWNRLHTFLSGSIGETRHIQDTQTLRRLINAFRQVAAPWVRIKQDSGTMLKVFKEADRDFRRQYGHV